MFNQLSVDYGGVICTPLGDKSGSCEYHSPTLWRLTCGSQGASRWSLRADAELDGILAFIPLDSSPVASASWSPCATMSWRDSTDSALRPPWGLIASDPAAWDSSPSSCYVAECIRPQVLGAAAECTSPSMSRIDVSHSHLGTTRSCPP